MEAKHQKWGGEYSLGMFKSTDELAAGEQSRSFWLAAPEERGQPRGELLLSPPAASPRRGGDAPRAAVGIPARDRGLAARQADIQERSWSLPES